MSYAEYEDKIVGIILLVLSNFTDTTTLVAQSFRWIVTAQFFDEDRCVTRDIARELDGIDAFQDNIVRSHRIGTGEWWCAWFRETKDGNV